MNSSEYIELLSTNASLVRENARLQQQLAYFRQASRESAERLQQLTIIHHEGMARVEEERDSLRVLLEKLCHDCCSKRKNK